MTELTHEQARRLIHLRADQKLDYANQALLDSHLEQCDPCNAYAKEINEVEGILKRVTNQKWNKRPAPLAVAMLLHSSGSKLDYPGNLVTTRMVAIAFAILGLIIGTWQFSRTSLSPASQALTLALPIPTPSPSVTSTSISILDCGAVIYKVQEGDTLDSIALQFAVAKSDIMTFNQMESQIIFIDQEINIPLCKSTPTGTIDTPTTTITPQLDPMATTPG